jgi:hypothetical protein
VRESRKTAFPRPTLLPTTPQVEQCTATTKQQGCSNSQHREPCRETDSEIPNFRLKKLILCKISNSFEASNFPQIHHPEIVDPPSHFSPAAAATRFNANLHRGTAQGPSEAPQSTF